MVVIISSFRAILLHFYLMLIYDIFLKRILQNSQRYLVRRSRYESEHKGTERTKFLSKTRAFKSVFSLSFLLLFFVGKFFLKVFFFYLGFLSRTFAIHGTAGEGEGDGIYLTPLYHFHPLHRHLGISRAITAGSSPLHIAGSRTRTGNLWFPSASC